MPAIPALPKIPPPPPHAGAAAHAGGSGKFDEDKHPRDHGKFSHSPGAQGTQEKPKPSVDERAKASLSDPNFFAEHADRLSRAGDSARDAFHRSEHGGDIAHAAAAEAIHNEARRIHQEADGHEPLHPDAVHAEHFAIGERHREARDAAVTLEAQRERAVLDAEEKAADEADTKTIADAEPEVEAGRLEPLPKEFGQLEAAHAKLTETRTAVVNDVKASRDAVFGAMDDVRATKPGEEWVPNSDDLDVSDEDFASSLNEDDFGEPEQERDRAIADRKSAFKTHDDPFEAAGGSSNETRDFDESIAEELSGAGARKTWQKPDRGDYDDGPDGDKDFEDAKAAYPDEAKAYTARREAVLAVVEERRAQHLDAVKAARDAVAAHLEKLDEADGKLGKAGVSFDKVRDKISNANIDEDYGVNHKFFDKHKIDETSGAYADPAVQVEFERVEELASGRLAAVERKLERLNSDHDDLIDHLDSHRDFAKDLLKKLDKVLKPKKTKAKKSNRPDGDEPATVVDMARYRLKLSKLSLISMVDQPAQETAGFRLIKRAGADPQEIEFASTTASIVKLVEGDNPLIYAWAFTPTGEDGQPYHDLQGDAVDADFIKAAEEFIAGGGPVDEMHDGVATSRIAFAFPMDSDIASAMFGKSVGAQLKTSGLMIAIRPTADQLAKARSGHFNGVSIAGIGTREVIKARKPKAKPKWRARLGKSSALTSETDGHQHSIDLRAPCSRWSQPLMTSSQTAEGAGESHSHAWVYDGMTGAITIAADDGHTHTIDAVIAADVIAEAAAPDDDQADDEPQDDDGDRKVVVIAARAPVSTPSGAARSVDLTSKENQMDLKILKAALSLPEAQRVHAASLSPEDALAFVGKAAGDRETIAKAALDADPIVHTSIDGMPYRKSAGEAMISMAKRLDAQAGELAVSKAHAEQVLLEKRAAADIGHLPGTIVIKAAALRAVDTIADEATRKSVVEMLKGGNAAMRMLGQPNGADGGAEPVEGDPIAKFNVELETFAKGVNKTPGAATSDFLRTPQGAQLYQATQTNPSRN